MANEVTTRGTDKVTVGSLLKDEQQRRGLLQLMQLNDNDEGRRKLRRFIGQAYQLYLTTPGLRDCEPMSVLLALKDVASWNLDLHPALGEAYLVPYTENEKVGATWFKVKRAHAQLGYRGVTKLARNSGGVVDIWLHTVWNWEEYREVAGSDPKIIHEPAPPPDGMQNPYVFENIKCAYAVALLPGGHRKAARMWRAELERSRARSQSYQNAMRYENDKSPWITDPGSMAMTKVAHRLGKQLDLSPDDKRIIRRVEAIEEGVVDSRDIENMSDAQLDALLDAPTPELGEGDDPPSVPKVDADPSRAKEKPPRDRRGGGVLDVQPKKDEGAPPPERWYAGVRVSVSEPVASWIAKSCTLPGPLNGKSYEYLAGTTDPAVRSEVTRVLAEAADKCPADAPVMVQKLAEACRVLDGGA